MDRSANLDDTTTYFVCPLLHGREGKPGHRSELTAHAPAPPYHFIPLKTRPGYTPNDASVGDLVGDLVGDGIVWQYMGYNQPPHPSLFLGGEMKILPPPDIVTIRET